MQLILDLHNSCSWRIRHAWVSSIITWFIMDDYFHLHLMLGGLWQSTNLKHYIPWNTGVETQEAAEDTDPHKHLTPQWAVTRQQAEVTRACCSSWCWELLKLRNVALLVCNWPQVKKPFPSAMEKVPKIWYSGCKNDRWRAECQLSSGHWNFIKRS